MKCSVVQCNVGFRTAGSLALVVAAAANWTAGLVQHCSTLLYYCCSCTLLYFCYCSVLFYTTAAVLYSIVLLLLFCTLLYYCYCYVLYCTTATVLYSIVLILHSTLLQYSCSTNALFQHCYCNFNTPLLHFNSIQGWLVAFILYLIIVIVTGVARYV